MNTRKVLTIFNEKPAFSMYYFTLGRGKPRREIGALWFTYRGRILGYFRVKEVVCNVGQLPRLNRIDGEPSEWQIKRDRYVAICNPPFFRLRDHVYHGAFRGWHYFNFDSYTQTMEAKIPL